MKINKQQQHKQVILKQTIFNFLIIKTTMKQFIYLNPLYLHYLHYIAIESLLVCVYLHIFFLIFFFVVAFSRISNKCLYVKHFIYYLSTSTQYLSVVHTLIHALFFSFEFYCDNQLGNIYSLQQKHTTQFPHHNTTHNNLHRFINDNRKNVFVFFRNNGRKDV